MEAASSADAFAAASHASLRAAGLAGEPVTVGFAQRALHLSGATSGVLRIEAGRCERVRFGYFQGKHYRLYVARIWLLGHAKPLVIEPAERECPAYGAAMRAFAGAVSATRGLESVERGLSGLSAVLVLSLSLLAMLIIAGVGLFALGSDLWLGGIALIGVSCLLGGVFIWLFFKRQRPRAVRSLDELEVQLPGAKSGEMQSGR